MKVGANFYLNTIGGGAGPVLKQGAPAFAAGVGFNLANLAILTLLVIRQRAARREAELA